MFGFLGNKAALDRSFAGKVSFVTGGASGIGRALCLELGRLNGTVIVADKNLSGAKHTKESICNGAGQAIALHLDISDESQFGEAISHAVKKFGRLDYIFNVAGVSLVCEIRDLDSSQWKKLVDINMMGTVYGSKLAYDIMLEQGHGHIVNISSAAGLITQPTTSIYTMTKHAIVGFTKCLIAEAKDLNIDVTLVCPGYVESNIFHSCELVNVERNETISQVPFKMMDTEKAAQNTLVGVSKKTPIVVFPFHARFFWFFSRIFPFLALRLAELPLKEFRQIRREIPK